jgi:maltooligosyltrehalose trehalohydrolase
MFRVPAPAARHVGLVIESGSGARRDIALDRESDGTYAADVHGVRPGTRYRYLIDGAGPYPDPVSRFQPLGVHGPSEVQAGGSSFDWSDQDWRGVAPEDIVFYEIHVGTFTPAGTFTALSERLPYLADLGATAVELMPVAEFPGTRNWGYDTASLFAPSHVYGVPDDLRRLVNTAHALGLAVFLDVVYNHLSPDGAYLAVFCPQVFTSRHASPWGNAVNLDGEGSALVRQLLVENALYWLHEFHVDGLRLDATHAIADDSPRHLLADLAHAVHEADRRHRRLLFAEDERNLSILVRGPHEGGYDLDGVWADDFHHELHRALTGEHGGYYADYAGNATRVAAAIDRGWVFCGQHSEYLNQPRGTDPAGIPRRRFVFCLQNHDQVGNRPHGERLGPLSDAAAWRAATALLLIAPETPLLFMGEEWNASTPFLYFTDHHDALGHLVTEGRLGEFRRLAALGDADAADGVPNPQQPLTFETSKLAWSEVDRAPHRAAVRLHRALLALRRTEPALSASAGADAFAIPVDDETVVVARRANGSLLLAIVRLTGSGAITIAGSTIDRLSAAESKPGAPKSWQTLLTTEEPRFTDSPRPPAVRMSDDGGLTVEFGRPAAVLVVRTAA